MKLLQQFENIFVSDKITKTFLINKLFDFDFFSIIFLLHAEIPVSLLDLANAQQQNLLFANHV